MDRYGVLARQAATTTWADLYTCPLTEERTFDSANISVRPVAVTRRVSALVTSIVICRLAATAGVDQWVSLAVVDQPGDSVTNADYILFQQDFSGGTTKVIGLSMTLSAGQTLRVISEANSSFNAIVNGVEIT